MITWTQITALIVAVLACVTTVAICDTIIILEIRKLRKVFKKLIAVLVENGEE